ncbi:tripeptidyl peptidase A [Gloeopeniophorella convolvens]|nr:tripeptidyl peptidase A [Gloeopeniophorella convolvens]
MRTLSLLVAFAAFASAAPSSLKLRQTVPAPRNWLDLGPAPAAHVIPLRIALPQPRFAELERLLLEISDPAHADYGAHLAKEDVEALVAPHPGSVDAVDAWLASHGIHPDACERSPAGDWVTVRVPVAQAERMLGTEFRVWQHAQDGDVLVRTTQYSLPAHLDGHVELIHPTTAFNRPRAQRTTFRFSSADGASATAPASNAKIAVPGSGASVDPSCNTTVTVSCLKQLYNVGSYVPRATKENAIALTGYLEQYANFADLRQFYEDQVPAAVNTSFKVVLINGGQNNQTLDQAGAEADLDVQFALGLTFPTPGTFFSTGGSPPFKPDNNSPTNTNEPYSEWLDFILKQENIPQTISTSYADDEQTVPEDFAKRVCAGFAQLGARGACLSNDGKNRTVFLPAFPASCPYVTTVGGTIHIPEVAVDFSGGGFSNYFPRPAYQEAAVANFLRHLPKGTFTGLFNPTGRAYPDVSAQADNFRIFLSGEPVSIGGTSASTPTFAGIVALLNDARLAAGRPALGFLNPLIYSLGGKGFNDITKGNNPGCNTPGFNATAGWDPITGFGTPDFAKLKDIVLGA